MVVIVLIGIATALILPDMTGIFEDVLLRSTARDLVSACGLASSQAVTLNQAHRVRLDLNGGRYLIERVSSQADRGSRFVQVDDAPGTRGELDRRIKVEMRRLDEDQNGAPNGQDRSPGSQDPQARPSQGDLMTFYPDGTADGEEILLKDRQGFGLVLRVDATTGRVRIRELPRQ
jgi:Tfp pilus assembly protein FimT